MLIDKLISCINELQIDLTGKTVLTEAASGAYRVTPVLAALAGAKVYAYTANSNYGTAGEIISQTWNLINEYDPSKLDITFIETLDPKVIYEADIITNSGHLRPLDKNKLQYAKENLVIPLMFEAWEWRDEDMDIEYIRQRGFQVGATNERHANIDVFNYLGDMALKLIFDSGSTIYRNKFILLCNNDFGPYIAKVVARNCEKLGIIDLPENKIKYDLKNAEWLGDFPDFDIPITFRDAEAIIFTAYPFSFDWSHIDSLINWKIFLEKINNPKILRYCGHLDENFLAKRKFSFHPNQVKKGHMGILPSAIGLDPIIRLQAGGFKVGELMLKGLTEFKNEILVQHL